VDAAALGAPWGRPSRRLAALLALVLLAGAVLLISDHAPRLRSESLRAHRGASLSALPTVLRPAAGDAALMHVGAHLVHGWLATGDLLVTPPAGPSNTATVTSVSEPATVATRVAHDAATGLEVWRLTRPWTASATASLPYDVATTALAATADGNHVAVAWAATPLGDPVRVTTSSLTVMGESVDPGLHAPLGTLSVDHTGHVVAFLAAPGRWLDARVVARLAAVDVHNQGCHLEWNLTGRDAPAGGVLVLHVPAGSSLRPGDVVTRFDGHPVNGLAALRSALYLAPSGERSTWTRDRQGRLAPDGTRLPCRP